MELSIIIPLYNEEVFLIELIAKLKEIKCPEYIKSKEISIVDDFSSDNSYRQAGDYVAGISNIYIYRHSQNQGMEAAVRTGISKAKGNTLIRCLK